MNAKKWDDDRPDINTSGGAYIEGSVETGGGDFVGRDQIIYQGPTYPRLNYRSDIADLINFYTQTFIGCEQEWSQLLRFTAQETSGYLLVEALPGYGKSALMAQLVHRHETEQWGETPRPELIYFFIRQEGQRHTPVAFLQAINSQLLTLLKLPGGVPPDLTTLRNQFSELWSQALAKADMNKPLLLLVDGLDELAQGEVTIVHLLPVSLAPYVHVVISSRANPAPLRQVSLQHPCRQAEVIRLDAFNGDELRILLQQYGAADKLAMALAPRVLTTTKGEPLFARFVCQEVVSEGKSALARLEQNPPANVEAYFQQQLEQLKAAAKGKLARDILGLLLVTLGGITTEEITEVLDASKWVTDEAIEPIRRFLLGETKFELMHLQLRKVLAQQFGQRERKKYGQLLLTWCQSYQQQNWPKETPDYVLAHYAQYLVEAGEREALYALISKRWMDLKFQRTFSHLAFAQDVERSIAVAETEEPLNLVQLIRGCLIYATLGELATNVPPEILGTLAQAGQVERALGYASLMQDKKRRSHAHRLISEALLVQGDVGQARAVLGQALAVAEAIEYEGDKAAALSEVAQVLATAGEVDRALALIEAGMNWDKQATATALSTVAQALATRGEVDRSLSAAEAIEDEGIRGLTLNGMAQALVTAGEVDMAWVLAKTVKEKIDITFALCRRAKLLSIAGYRTRAAKILDRAMTAAEVIEDEGVKVNALSEVFKVLVEVGDKAGATKILDQVITTVEAIEDEGVKVNALSEVFKVLVEVGDKAGATKILDQVITTVEAIEDQEIRMFTWNGINQMLAAVKEFNQAFFEKVVEGVEAIRAEDVKLALEIITLVFATSREIDRTQVMAKEINYDEAKANTLRNMAQALAAEGKFEQALVVAEVLEEDKGDKVRALREAVQMLTAVGERAKVIKFFDLILTAAKAIKYKPDKTYALREVAQMLAAIGEIDQAQVVVETIEDEWIKHSFLMETVQTLITVEEFDQVLLVAEVIEDKITKAITLCEVALALATAKEVDRALAVAQAIEVEEFKASALSKIAQALAAGGDKVRAVKILDWALAVAEVIKDASHKADVLSEVAQALVAVGDKTRVVKILDQALTVAEAIESWAKPFTFHKIAQALVEVGEFDWALATIEAIEDNKTKTSALLEMAQALVGVGEFDRALATVEAIKYERGKADSFWTLATDEARDKAIALCKIAQALVKVGEVDRALATVETIEDKRIKALAWREMAQALAAAGKVDQTWMVVEAIKNEKHKTYVLSEATQILSEAAQTLAAAGYTVGAINLLDRVLTAAQKIDKYKRGKTDTLPEVAAALARVGEIDRALAVAEAAEVNCAKAPALSKVVEALIAAGEVERALAVAEMINFYNVGSYYGSIKAEVLHEIGQALAATGDRARAVKIFEQALIATRAIWDEWTKAVALGDVAQALVAVGEVNWALVVAEGIEDKGHKANVLREAAQALIAVGQVDQALTVAEAIEDWWDKPFTLRKIAQALVEMREFDRALATIEALEDNKTKTSALLEMAQALVEMREFDRALAIVEAIKYESDTLPEVAAALARVGEIDRALAVVETIKNERAKISALSKVGEVLATMGEVDQVLAVAGKINSERDRASVLRQIAQFLAEKGEGSRALAVAEAIQAEEDRVSVLHKVSQTLALVEELEPVMVKMREFEQVMAAVENIKDLEDVISYLGRVWQTWGTTWREAAQGCVMIIDRALTAGVVDESEFYRFSSRRVIMLAAAGEVDRAIAMVETAEDERDKADALSWVAEVLTMVGEADRAFTVAEAIKDESKKVSTLCDMAMMFIAMKQPMQARWAWRNIIASARFSGRQNVFKALEHSALTLACLDKGETLWRMYEAVMEVESWWETETMQAYEAG